MESLRFDEHNAAVAEVWDAYRQRRPMRVPLIFGVNTRFTMFEADANPRGFTFEQYFSDPQIMLERQLEHQEWIRFNIPQDAEMGYPAGGWHIGVDFQNVYEAAWFGCELQFCAHEVPDTLPLLRDDDRKRLLFDRGLPDPYTGGLMQRNWEFYDYLVARQADGFTWKDLPLAGVSPTGLGTDGPLTVACNVRGAGEFLTDLLEDPAYAHELLDYITEATIARIVAYRKRLGQPLKTQSWGFADDSVQLISGALYEEFIYPRHKRLVDTFSDGGPNSIHLCGNATRHFPRLKELLNIQSFDTGFPVDFKWLREALGPDIEILGGPSAPFLRQATPEQTRQEAARILNSGIMDGGRFVLREGNNLSPGTPLENLRAMYDIVQRCGAYC